MRLDKDQYEACKKIIELMGEYGLDISQDLGVNDAALKFEEEARRAVSEYERGE